jgi:hypothetical protein
MVKESVIQSSDTTVRAVTASQVDYMVLKHANERIKPQIFICNRRSTPLSRICLLRIPDTNKRVTKSAVVMKGIQLPVVSNNATTGHKLQGSSVDTIFVHHWVYEKNWAYVVLSRVRTHKGLHLRHPLSMDLRKYAVPPKLAEMLRSFERRQCKPF